MQEFLKEVMERIREDEKSKSSDSSRERLKVILRKTKIFFCLSACRVEVTETSGRRLEGVLTEANDEESML